MPDENGPTPEGEKPRQEEEEFERRFREIQDRTKRIADRARAPEPPEIHERASSNQPAGQPNPLQEGQSSKAPAAPRTPSHLDSGTPPHVQRGIGIAFAIGYSFVGPLVAGIIVGSLLDGHPGGTWTTVGILLGTVIAFVLLIRLVNKLNRE